MKSSGSIREFPSGSVREIYKQHPIIDNIKVSNLGNIVNLRKNKLYKQWNNKFGYKMISISNKSKNKHYTVHRLVLETFLGNSNLVINHIDCDKTNNCLNNLEYVTQSYNVKYAYKKGKKLPPQKGKISFEVAIEIREKSKHGINQRILSKEYNISPQSINDIVKERTWVNNYAK